MNSNSQDTLTMVSVETGTNGHSVVYEQSITVKKDFMERLTSKIPLLGIVMALLSALCFATAGKSYDSIWSMIS